MDILHDLMPPRSREFNRGRLEEAVAYRESTSIALLLCRTCIQASRG